MANRLPNIGITPKEVFRLKEKRKLAAEAADDSTDDDSGDDDEPSQPSELEIQAEAIAKKCCFYLSDEKFRKQRCEELKNLPNDLVQKVLDQIYLEEKSCFKHVDDFTSILLNSKVTEFNYLSLWKRYKDDGEGGRGFVDLEELCLKCPELEKLETVEERRFYLDPHFHDFTSERNVIRLKKLTRLALSDFDCTLKALWLIQEHLPELGHLEITLGFVLKKIAEPLAEMENLKTLGINIIETNYYGRKKPKDTNIDVLVECAGRIQSLEILNFDCGEDDGRDFLDKFSTQCPEKRLHVDKIFLKKFSPRYPWPKFLTCDEIEFEAFTKNLDVQQSFAHMSIFPLELVVFQKCSAKCILQLLTILGPNIEKLSIHNDYLKRKVRLDRVMALCPKMNDLEIYYLDVTCFIDQDSAAKGFYFKAEHFAQLQCLSLIDNCREMPSDSGTVDYYKQFLLRAKDVTYLHVDYVVFSKAALQAMDEDGSCFEKVQKLAVSTSDDDEESLLAYVLARKMMSRSPVLKEISIVTHTCGPKDYDDKDIVLIYVKKLKVTAKKLGIKVIHEDEEDC